MLDFLYILIDNLILNFICFFMLVIYFLTAELSKSKLESYDRRNVNIEKEEIKIIVNYILVILFLIGVFIDWSSVFQISQSMPR